MDKAQVDRWLDAYVTAWKSYDRDLIGALFAEDVAYRFHPFDEPVTGRVAVVGAWLGEDEHPGAPAADEPGTFDAVYRTVAVDGDVAVATGSSTYLTEPGGPVGQVFDNCFVMRFDQAGRCREFTEWYIRRPRPEGAPPEPEQA
jgi:ketosteroid isomerase-like protein